MLSRCKVSTKLQADEALTMVAKLHGCMPSDVPTLTYSRDYGVSWEYHLVSTLLQFELCIVQFTSQNYFIIQEELKAQVNTQRTKYNKRRLGRRAHQTLGGFGL